MSDNTLISNSIHPRKTKSSGYCIRCKTVHMLGSEMAVSSGHSLMQQLGSLGSIDLSGADPNENGDLKTEYLFGDARGKMFGVMACMRPDGSIMTLRAFSGQYNGRWKVKGWVPPLFDTEEVSRISSKVEQHIKAIGSEIDLSLPHSDRWLLLRKKRRQLSQNLMRDIHSLYRLTNFRGDTATLYQTYIGNNGIPTGTGDCCAPKLLNYAAKKHLLPLGMTEFYWGRENKSANRQHGAFYSSCKEKCEPILGFMLCGINSHECRHTAT